MGRKLLSRELEVDLSYVADVLRKVKNPWHRYQLTMIIDYYAAKFEAEETAKLKRRKPKAPKVVRAKKAKAPNKSKVTRAKKRVRRKA